MCNTFYILTEVSFCTITLYSRKQQTDTALLQLPTIWAKDPLKTLKGLTCNSGYSTFYSKSSLQFIRHWRKGGKSLNLTRGEPTILLVDMNGILIICNWSFQQDTMYADTDFARCVMCNKYMHKSHTVGMVDIYTFTSLL